MLAVALAANRVSCAPLPSAGAGSKRTGVFLRAPDLSISGPGGFP
jgi:hypothetical protein